MKTKFFLPVFIVVSTLLAIFTFSINSKSVLIDSEEGIENPEEEEAAFSEKIIQGEMEMLQDPKTGKIPSDARQKEMAFIQSVEKNNFPDEKSAVAWGYTFIGPNNIGGRTRAIAYDKRNFNIAIAGGVSGDLFRSPDGGQNWQSVFSTARATCLAQDPRSGSSSLNGKIVVNNNVWYMGTGEDFGSTNNKTNRNLGIPGRGLWRSSDNGINWKQIVDPLFNDNYVFDLSSDYIRKAVVDPASGSVYLAVSSAIIKGTPTAPGSLDLTWAVVLGNGKAEACPTDVAVSSNGRVYASFSSMHNTASTTYDGIWTSPTGKINTFTKIVGASVNTISGWPASGVYGSIALAIAPSNENIIWALYADTASKNTKAVLWKFTKSINSFTGYQQNLFNPITSNSQGGYNLCLTVKPDAENIVFIGTTNLYRFMEYSVWSTNTAKITNYGNAIGEFTDFHTLTFIPGTNILAFGCDQGIAWGDASCYNPQCSNLPSWFTMNKGYVSTQFFNVGINPNKNNLYPQYIGGMQDKGTWYISEPTGNGNHQQAWGADGFACALFNGNKYSSTQTGRLVRDGVLIEPVDVTNPAISKAFWYFDFYMDPGSGRIFYSNGNDIYRADDPSTVVGATPGAPSQGWTKLVQSSNLQYFNFSKSLYENDVVSCMASSSDNTALFVGTTNGVLWRLDNFGTSLPVPKRIYYNNMLENMNSYFTTSISVDPFNANNVMVTFGNYNVSSIYYSTNALSGFPTWTEVEGNLKDLSIRSCVIDNNLLEKNFYVGTSAGLYKTTVLNGSSTLWSQDGKNTIKNAVVNALAYRATDATLLVGTHGRGMFKREIGVNNKTEISEDSEGNKEEIISIYPNPVSSSGKCNALFSLRERKNCSVFIYSLEGKIVFSKIMNFISGTNQFEIPVERMTKGIYFLKIEDLPAKKFMVENE